MKIAFDIGGTKISACVQQGEKAPLHEIATVPTPQEYQNFISQITSLVDQVRHLGTLQHVGISLAGVRRGKTILANNLPFLTGKDVFQDLEKQLGCTVKIANDADCFALAEAHRLQTSQRVVGVILGTGVGAGLVVNGVLQTGANGVAGEVGHIPLDWHGTFVESPIYRPVEHVLAGNGFVQLFEQALGKTQTSFEIAEKLRQNQKSYLEIYQRYCDYVARFLAGIINFWDPTDIIIGGGLSQLPNLVPTVEKTISSYALLPPLQTRLWKAQLGADAGKYGALLL